MDRWVHTASSLFVFWKRGKMLTAIISPKVCLIVIGVIVVGGVILTRVTRKKYEWTLEREEELEQKTEQGLTNEQLSGKKIRKEKKRI